MFALLQAAGFTGAMGGFAMVEDFQSGSMDRLMTTAPARAAIVLGYVMAMLVRAAIAIAILTPVAYALGMRLNGTPLEIVGLFGLAALLNIVATLWSCGVAMYFRSYAAAALMFMPLFLLLPRARLRAAGRAHRLVALRRRGQPLYSATSRPGEASSPACPRMFCGRTARSW